MTNIIRLLPDTIANQIAAGEVIQRPSSVIKELVENAVDAHASEIEVDIKDSGKTLIMVTDNGMGMNETDARMSLERHATSKISVADDLFAIRTKGFRGEALASICAISHMEMKTKNEKSTLGNLIRINGGEIETQEAISCAKGTQISVKNLFYNVPARRKFLKSDNVEMRHIIDQFERVALAHPEIKFTLRHNGNYLFQLNEGNLRQRLVGVFGKKYNDKLVPVDQETLVVNISGFVLKPEAAKRTRGEQFFFVNNRFIKSPYLHQMVLQAYEELLPKGFHPGYFLYLEVDPSTIDINIHPTKTEVKFEDERTIGMILRSSVKQAIGMFNISPTIDFDLEVSFNSPPPPAGKIFTEPKISVNPQFNPFHSENNFSSSPSKKDISGLQSMYEGLSEQLPAQEKVIQSGQLAGDLPEGSNQIVKKQAFQIRNKYIVTSISSGIIIINQTRAHQRILFDQFIHQIENGQGSSQQLLFPENITFSAGQSELLISILPHLTQIGFDIEPFGPQNFIVRGMPSLSSSGDPKTLIEGVLYGFESNMEKPDAHLNEALASALAFKTSIKTGQQLSQEEINALVDELFSSENPMTLPNGKSIFHKISIDEIEDLFN
jgi:DNA mismatch repair protein MutL